MAEPKDQPERYQEFLELMPLTLALAGLPPSEPGKYFTEEQIETRVYTLRHAYKQAQQAVRELLET